MKYVVDKQNDSGLYRLCAVKSASMDERVHGLDRGGLIFVPLSDWLPEGEAWELFDTKQDERLE